MIINTGSISSDYSNCKLAVFQVINFMYTGRIQIVTEGVEELLNVADMFDIQEVREACTDTLIRNLCPENCISE